MNAEILINGVDATDLALLEQTRISYDSSRNIATATVAFIGESPGSAARYDEARYDEDHYSLGLAELQVVTIRDGRDHRTKLFEGQIYGLDLKQSDAADTPVLWVCDLNDYGSWLDRSIAWDDTFAVPMPTSDQTLIVALVGKFCPQISTAHVGSILPVILNAEWKGKTLRQVLDDTAALSGGVWWVDFDGQLWYGAAEDAPAAPYGLSTSPDYAATFPVRVDGYKRDFSNPVNHAYIRGGQNGSGILAEADYKDPVSIEQYGEYSYFEQNDQITETYDAELKAKTAVLQYAYPVEQGSFTVWTDDLKLGQRVQIQEDALGIDGAYIIRSLNLTWKSKELVEYQANFGAAQPDLVTYLRLIDQRARWKSANQGTKPGPPAPGSVTDASIASGGLSAQSIGSVAAGAIVGQLSAGQIDTVSANSIRGFIEAGQIGTVNATSIQGVVVSDQLANGIIDDLSKYADALRPIPILDAFPALPADNYPPNSFFFNNATGHFYQVAASGTSYTDAGTDPNTLTGAMKFYQVGKVAAQNITGLILAAQIGSITAGQITGAIQAAQIGAVNASTIQGKVSATQIDTITANQISTAIQAGQIGSINGAVINVGTVGDSAIAAISGGKITAGSVSSDKLNAYSIDVGGGSSAKPARLNVYDSGNSLIAQLGYLDASGNYGGWFKVFGAGGTSYTNAVIKSDVSGNLTITNASFSITASGYTLTTTPTTFDASYGSLALQITSGSDKASHVSRGMVIYNGSTVIGALVRDPNNANNCQLALGGTNVLCDGNSGYVRVSNYFSVAGNIGVSTGGLVTVSRLNIMGGIVIGWG